MWDDTLARALMILCIFAWFNLFWRMGEFLWLWYFIGTSDDYNQTEAREAAHRLRWFFFAWLCATFFMTWVIKNYI